MSYMPDPYRDEDAERGVYKGHMWIPARDFQPDGAAPPTDATYGTNAQSIWDIIQFDYQTADDEAFAQVPVPPSMLSGNRITMRIWWIINATTGGVHWDGALNVVGKDAAMDAAGTGFTGVSTTVPGTAYLLTYTDIDFDVETIVGPGMMNIRLFRDISDAGDTATAVADMLGVELLWDKFADP